MTFCTNAHDNGECDSSSQLDAYLRTNHLAKHYHLLEYFHGGRVIKEQRAIVKEF